KVRAGWPAQIDKEKLSLAAGKALHRHLEAPRGRLGESRDAPGEIASAIPRLNGEPLAAQIEREILSREGQQFFARFKQCGLAAVFQECLDSSADLFGAAARASQ